MASSSSSPPPFLLRLLILLLHLLASKAQQPYINNAQLNCYASNASSALGYSCNGLSSSCPSFLTFRARSPYLSPALIAFLLSANTENVSRINSVSDVDPLPSDDLIIVPVPCSCSGPNAQFYQHNASYTIKVNGETYLTVANDTYQGLSSCQALMDQNPIDSRHINVGDVIVVPLRCACPTLNQTRSGIKYLVSYLVTWEDDVPTIAQRFNADYPSVLAANQLNEKSIIYPFTTLLIPLRTEPTAIASPPSPAPDVSPPPPAGSGGSSHKWVFVGVGIGVGVLLILGVPALFFCLRRRPQEMKEKPVSGSGVEYGALPSKPSSSPSPATPSPLPSSVIQRMLDSMKLYEFEELERATGNFGEDHSVIGAVYRAVINGDSAAVKRLEGNASNEINILKQISHSSIIKLSGFCLHEGNTYMVYEFADLGSLSDWIHHKKKMNDSYCLTWKQRIQIACDIADGLNYLHNYSNPPYIHNNLKSSNVLLGQGFRAKISNFCLARPVGEEEEGGMNQLTRHIVGTVSYMAPEYLEHGLITPKVDVFAFGVVLLELLSGQEATFAGEDERKRGLFLWAAIDDVLSGEDVRRKLRGFVDNCLRDEYPFDLAFAMAELAKRCASNDAASRPTMIEVLVSLSAIYNSTLDWEPEDLSRSFSGSAIYRR
ncbi:Protein LYK5 [Apostasia shenzhenica]|uniref:Protein LYK5 n=1 Tax=Apostasia shenzhenica TaxID=1088818 RepID=A0A2I0ABB8_9ASPA|nr:Protein LYK5 [Apostasia shenzhenica]